MLENLLGFQNEISFGFMQKSFHMYPYVKLRCHDGGKEIDDKRLGLQNDKMIRL